MFKLAHNATHPFNPILTTDWRWILRAAWGDRQNPDGSRYDWKRTGAIGATITHWLRWTSQQHRDRAVYVVQPRRTHTRSMTAVLDNLYRPPEPTATPAAGDIEQLQTARIAARANRDFAEADRLRDELTRLGVDVRDGRL